MKSLQLQKPFGTSDVFVASPHSNVPFWDCTNRLAGYSRHGHTREWQNCRIMFSILFPLLSYLSLAVCELSSHSAVRRAYRESLADSFWRKDVDNRTWFICLIYVGLFDFAKLTSSLKKDVRWNFQLKGARGQWEISAQSSAKLCALILLHTYCSSPPCVLPVGHSLGAGLGDLSKNCQPDCFPWIRSYRSSYVLGFSHAKEAV